jgi:hypothetical protein
MAPDRSWAPKISFRTGAASATEDTPLSPEQVFRALRAGSRARATTSPLRNTIDTGLRPNTRRQSVTLRLFHHAIGEGCGPLMGKWGPRREGRFSA